MKIKNLRLGILILLFGIEKTANSQSEEFKKHLKVFLLNTASCYYCHCS